jgi:glycosyltransferase involved in cell wall biosynthesis
MTVSVIICTHNGAARIRPTLEALAHCTADSPVEIILVDNNCTDSTVDVARQIWAEIGNSVHAFRIVREKEQGLSFARRAGVKAARGDIIVFCDDDNWLASDYLTVASEIMCDERMGAAGGQCDAVIEGQIPTFLYSHGTGYALGIQALESGDVTRRGYLWGSGLVVRRRDMLALYTCPGFPLMTGRAAARLTAGDDSEICAALILLGKRLWYDNRLRLKHWIAPHRLTPEYNVRLNSGFAEGMQQYRYYLALLQLRSRPAVLSLVINALRYLHALGDSNARAYPRFALLSMFRLGVLMNETERRFYVIYRYLLAAARRSAAGGNQTSDRPASYTTAL